MFETVLGRLQALAQAEGFDPQPGTVINGELRAYAAGIALVYDQLTDAREGSLCRHCCRRKSLALADGSRFAAGGYPARDPPKAAGAAANALGRFFLYRAFNRHSAICAARTQLIIARTAIWNW